MKINSISSNRTSLSSSNEERAPPTIEKSLPHSGPLEIDFNNIFKIDLTSNDIISEGSDEIDTLSEIQNTALIHISHNPEEIIINLSKELLQQEDIDPISEMDTDPLHLESARLRQNIKEYKEEVEKEDLEKIREKERQEEIDEYNRRLYEQIIERKKYNNQKKKIKDRAKKSFLRMLFGSEEENDLRPIIIPSLLALHFYNSQMKSIYKISAIEPIAPIRWDNSYLKYKQIKENEKPFVKIKRFIEHIFAGLYRSWINQNVLIKPIPRERSPPFFNYSILS